MKSLFIVFVLCASLFFACRFSPNSNLTLKVRVPENSRPSGADKFDCYVVTVTGSDLASGLSGDLAACLKLGKMSEVVAFDTLHDTGVSLNVPAGVPITLRLLGIEKSLSKSCSELEFSSLLESTTTQIYELGQEQTTAYADSVIEIKNKFESSASDLVAQCQSSSGGGGTTALTLAHVYESSATAGAGGDLAFDEAIGNVPPTDFNGSPMTEILDLSTLTGAGARLFFREVGQVVFERVDFLFTLPSGRMPERDSALIRVDVSAMGGLGTPSSVECSVTDLISGGAGYRVEAAFNSRTPINPWKHDLPITTASSSDLSLQTQDFSPASLFIVREGGTDYFHLSMRSKSPSISSRSPGCSAVRLATITASLVQ